MSSNIFLIIAVVTTGIFVIQFILSIFSETLMRIQMWMPTSVVWCLLRD